MIHLYLSRHLVVFVLLCISKTMAQSDEDPIEALQLKSTYELEHPDWLDHLLQHKYSKLDLNSAGPEELQELGTLSPAHIEGLLAHRARFGKLLCIYELKAVQGFDDGLIAQILPYVYVYDQGLSGTNQSLVKDLLEEERHYLIARVERNLQPQLGYSDDASTSNRYLGNPFKYYIRYRVAHQQRFSIGLTMEKDPGEQFIWHATKMQIGFDHMVAHIQIKNKGLLKNLVAGNFTLSTGQGLVFANGMHSAKSAESVLTVRRNQLGIMPFNSILESGFFKGVGISVGRKNWESTFFISQKRLDTQRMEDSLVADESYFSNIYTSGLHGTARSYGNKNTMNKYDAGYNIRWSHRTLKIGHTGCYTGFRGLDGHPVALQHKPQLYNSNAFEGTYNWAGSIDMQYSFRNINVFGEAAQQLLKGRALIIGTQVVLGSRLDLALLYRNYNAYYNSFYAHGFGEYFNNSDEQGLYMGVKYTPGKRWVVTAYSDLFYNKYLKYRQYTPGQGAEYLAGVTYKHNKKLSLYLQYKQESKPKNRSDDTELLYKTAIARKTLLSMVFRYDLDKHFSLQTKLFKSMYEQLHKSHGLVWAQDIAYKCKSVTWSARVALFDVEDHENRIYLYEKDVLYAFSFPMYEGTGVKYYAIVQVNLLKNLRMWVRWSHTQYHDRKEIGTGGARLEGSNMDTFKLQLQWVLQ